MKEAKLTEVKTEKQARPKIHQLVCHQGIRLVGTVKESVTVGHAEVTALEHVPFGVDVYIKDKLYCTVTYAMIHQVMYDGFHNVKNAV